MCAECDEVNFSIARYKRFASEGLDALTIQRIHDLIAQLEGRLVAIHPAEPADPAAFVISSDD